MNSKSLGHVFLEELEAEVAASRKCLERYPEGKFDWKPHEKSMQLGYLTMMVAEIPAWIVSMIEQGEIDFAKFEHKEMKTADDFVRAFDANMEAARTALRNVTDEELEKPFSLKRNGELLFTSPKRDNIGSTINHSVHHRGQLTVYYRLLDIPVPSIYGPSADDRTW